MGAEHSQQRADLNDRDTFGSGHSTGANSTKSSSSAATPNNSAKHRNMLRQNTGTTNLVSSIRSPSETNSPTTSELGRAPSPPLSVCSDLPYVSYTDRPIGDSPKIRNKNSSSLYSSTTRAAARKSYPGGVKPKRPQSTSISNIVVVKPGAKDNELDVDPDIARLRTIPQFLPVIRDTVTSASFTREPEILERLPSVYLLNICTRMQTHYNMCATQVATEQNKLVERTKMVSNTITTLFASFVDMQKTYAAYAEQFAKIRQVSQQLSRCNALLNDNLESLETINNFLDVEDRLEPFVWRTDDGKAGHHHGGQMRRL